MTTVTRAAEAPRAASAISSSSTRCSCTGGTSGWMMKTSRSRQLACSWTSRQSLANRCSGRAAAGRPGSRRSRRRDGDERSRRTRRSLAPSLPGSRAAGPVSSSFRADPRRAVAAGAAPPWARLPRACLPRSWPAHSGHLPAAQADQACGVSPAARPRRRPGIDHNSRTPCAGKCRAPGWSSRGSPTITASASSVSSPGSAAHRRRRRRFPGPGAVGQKVVVDPAVQQRRRVVIRRRPRCPASPGR